MEEVIIYKALYNYSPSDDEITEGYIALRTDDVVEVQRTEKFEEECDGNIQVGFVPYIAVHHGEMGMTGD